MRRRLFVFAVVFVLCAAMLGGCGAIKTVDEAKGVLGKYMTCFSEADADAMISTLHSSLVEDLGGEVYTQIRLNGKTGDAW